MRLGARVVAGGADADRRFQDLGIETADRLIPPVQVVEVEWFVLRGLSQHGQEIAPLRLVLAGVRHSLFADPAHRRAGDRVYYHVLAHCRSPCAQCDLSCRAGNFFRHVSTKNKPPTRAAIRIAGNSVMERHRLEGIAGHIAERKTGAKYRYPRRKSEPRIVSQGSKAVNQPVRQRKKEAPCSSPTGLQVCQPKQLGIGLS